MKNFTWENSQEIKESCDYYYKNIYISTSWNSEEWPKCQRGGK